MTDVQYQRITLAVVAISAVLALGAVLIPRHPTQHPQAPLPIASYCQTARITERTWREPSSTDRTTHHQWIVVYAAGDGTGRFSTSSEARRALAEQRRIAGC